jgi:polyisoprenoid-binding protein YceI
MMTRKALAGLALAVITAGPVLAADSYVLDKSHSEATFQVAHLGISKVRGRFNDFAGKITIDAAKPEASSVEFSVKVASVDTQEPKRDTHLRSADFFDAEKMPEMTFKSSKVAQLGPDKFEVTGTFTLHGVSKQITLPVRLVGFVKTPWGDERAGFETATTINRKDYGLLWNKTLDAGGLLVGDEVAIAVNIEAVKQKDAAPAK